MLGFKRGLPLIAGAVGVTLAALVAPAYASGTAQLKAFVAQVKSARGEFEQKQVKGQQDGALKVSNAASGTFEFARPGRFIWRYVKPYDQLLQADGETLYIYDKDLNQVTERKLGASLGASPAAILFGSNDIEKNFTLKDAGVKNGIDWVELKPKAKDTQFQRVGIGFRDGNLAAMELYDAFGNVTLLTFDKIQKNPPMSADNFKFTMPKGADLIKG
ncbi:outer membrane lipoprotein chaperone LolA [Pandoraea sp. XJJ-1]|uniref:Outer-membrane lipoprotein carrier protein n=1 Tax=Pandoraea cepalis TaxID=2508294 RepID=A0A5E4XB62_9BURK|nr:MULTISPECIES: outer membrane lipoprotein chaperone LolA [Pandoraea]MBN9114753.1 outer membrane lipoprotein chaperone LolA [Pandoraea sp.]OJY22153.1 MAG: outer membrane lipoprotein carrier protein LolA [Pandoraea sp. 64-18]WAL83997.1 outer membrane lipoprotein chaperone LolA [Pandoraea sp. XJJ-1]VVE33483.1 membrane protein [Pandoraea cepalis]BDD90725.1 outer-membrane lipoprotein carrier protein [Pandoraea sp. NE5]